MARTRREKKEEAKETIRDLVPTIPLPRFAPPPLRAINLILKGAERLGTGLVELDPLGIITEPVVQTMVNDPSFKLTQEMVDLINDDERMVLSDGQSNLIETSVNRFPSSVRRQFDRASLVSRIPISNKRTRKKTKTDKNMSKALREANARLRTKKGLLRKGKTQADVMRLAHRLRKKMS